jgi:hypothetical protein
MSKQTLPKEQRVMFDSDSDELCAHLQPVLKYLLAKGGCIERLEKNLPGSRLVVVLSTFFYKKEMLAAFDMPGFVVWEYADPHYGVGNSINCEICRNSIEGGFDLSDPHKTLGE